MTILDCQSWGFNKQASERFYHLNGKFSRSPADQSEAARHLGISRLVLLKNLVRLG